jgi:plastocyanin
MQHPSSPPAQRRLAPALLWLAGLILLPGIVRAGSLEGRIVLTPWSGDGDEATSNPYPGMLGSMPHEGHAHDLNDPRDVVVWLAEPPADASPDVAKTRPQLNQVGQEFTPRVLGITVGTTVDFYNFDPVFHNVFSYSKAKRFDLGRYGKGKARSVTFNKAGLVKVFCDIHSNMAAFIFVVDSPMVVQPDENGNFLLRHVPPGTYALKVWHPERGEKTIRVRIDDGASRADVQL